MPGTKAGSAKTVAKILAKNPNHFKEIGSKGGKMSGTGGFWHLKYIEQDVKSIQEAGSKGGKVSRRGKAQT